MKPSESHISRWRITPRARLAIWAASVILVALSTIWMASPGPGGVAAATVHALFALTVMVALLATTPADAIRLTAGSSVVLLTLGWAWLVLPHLALHGPIMLLAAAPGLAALAYAWSRRDRLTLWAAAPVLWHPAFPAAAACIRVDSAPPLPASLGAVAFALLTTVLLRTAPQRPAPALLAWLASSGFTLLLIRRLVA